MGWGAELSDPGWPSWGGRRRGEVGSRSVGRIIHGIKAFAIRELVGDGLDGGSGRRRGCGRRTARRPISLGRGFYKF